MSEPQTAAELLAALSIPEIAHRLDRTRAAIADVARVVPLASEDEERAALAHMVYRVKQYEAALRAEVMRRGEVRIAAEADALVEELTRFLADEANGVA